MRQPRSVLSNLLAERVVVCDGAMGTMLHAAGIPLDRWWPELNISRPDLVRDVHTAYARAGATILQTNTFGANRLRLAGVDPDLSVSELNIAGARLAKLAAEQAERLVLVAGSVGPATSTSVTAAGEHAREAALREQIAALADWVDLLILETFGDLESLVRAIELAKEESDLEIIAQLTFGPTAGRSAASTPRRPRECWPHRVSSRSARTARSAPPCCRMSSSSWRPPRACRCRSSRMRVVLDVGSAEGARCARQSGLDAR